MSRATVQRAGLPLIGALLFVLCLGSFEQTYAMPQVGTAPSRCLLSASNPPPVGTAPCPGVRPGALVRIEGGACTMNFLFRGSDGRRYIGMAGHCTLSSSGEVVNAPGRGPMVEDGNGQRIGEAAYAILKGDFDFALIRLDRNIKPKAGMCYFGGPTGVNDDITSDNVTLHHYGNGMVMGNASVVNQPTLPARTAMAPGMPERNVVYAVGAAIFGDSGSAVIDDEGKAVGVLVGADTEGGIVITRITPQVELAEEALDVDLRLVKAPMAE